MNWDDVEFLWDHDAPDDGVDEEREKDITQEYQNAHQDADEKLLGGVHDLFIQANKPRNEPHRRYLSRNQVLFPQKSGESDGEL